MDTLYIVLVMAVIFLGITVSQIFTLQKEVRKLKSSVQILTQTTTAEKLDKDIKSLQKNQQRQAAVNEGYFNASVAKGNASFAKTKAILSLAQSGVSTIAKLDEIAQKEKGKQEGLDFLKPELGGSIVDETPNQNLEDVARYEGDLTSKNVDIVKSAKSVEPNDAKLQEEIQAEATTN